MLELDLRRFQGQSDAAEVATDLVRKAREMAATSNRLAVDFLIKAIGITTSHTKNEAYFAEALQYLCGQLLAHADVPREAAAAIAASGVLPGSGGIPLFDDAVAESIALAHAQDEAISRSVPAVLLASMPRSASAALTQTLAEILRAPLFRISLGPFPHSELVPVWFRRFLRGGAILHDHFGATEFNIDLLRAHGVQTVNVLIRDPRAAAASYAKHWTKVAAKGRSLEFCYEEHYIPWLQGWLDADKRSDIAIRWIRSADVTASPDSLRAVLASILEADKDRFAGPIAAAMLVAANFVTGDPDAWRASASPALQKKMWDLLPVEIIERLELRP
jgi:hypothetical protein